MSFSDPIDGTNAGPAGSSSEGSRDDLDATPGGTGGGTGYGASPASTGGDPGGLAGTSTGGLGGSMAGGDAGTAGGSGEGGYGASSDTGTPGGLGAPSGTTGTGTGGYGASPGTLTGPSTGAGTGTGYGTGRSESGGYGSTDTTGRGTGADGFSGSTGVGTAGSTGTGGSTGETGGVGEDFELHEPEYRRHYTTVGTETAGATGTYDEARTGYAAGHAAAANPAYADRGYEEVEVELEKQVGSDRYARVRDFARHAFEWKRVLAGVALVAGGYWASRKLFSAAGELSEEDEQDCRTYYEAHAVRTTGVPYTQARTVYVLGYMAGRNPDYAGRAYDDVEPHLRGGFTGRRGGNYDALRDFGRRGYERSSTRGLGGGPF